MLCTHSLFCLHLSCVVVMEEDSAAAQQYSRQGCPTGLRADLWALILNATNQPQVWYTVHTHTAELHSGGRRQLAVFAVEQPWHTQLQWFPEGMFTTRWNFQLRPYSRLTVWSWGAVGPQVYSFPWRTAPGLNTLHPCRIKTNTWCITPTELQFLH